VCFVFVLLFGFVNSLILLTRCVSFGSVFLHSCSGNRLVVLTTSSVGVGGLVTLFMPLALPFGRFLGGCVRVLYVFSCVVISQVFFSTFFGESRD